MADSPSSTALNDAAPTDEKTDALGQLMSNVRPDDSAVREVMEYIIDDMREQDFAKSLTKQNVIPFPSTAVKQKKDGMQSVDVDDFQILINGDYIEKPGMLNFDSMRAMVDQTPILSSIVLTRIRQVDAFCRIQDGGAGPGFSIRHRDAQHDLSDNEQGAIKKLASFFENCGWETNPRRRRALKRDSFSQFMKKIVRDTLTMDSVAIETEMKRDRSLGLDGMYAVDGGTIRLCSELGYHGDDEIYALQVVQGRIRTVYTYDDLIYEPRNPRSDILVAGYGFGEVEMLVKTVTGYLNALTYNQRYFDSNALPKGVLHMSGDYSERDVAAFKRYWNSMVKGVNNAWTLPVLFSKDQESRAAFEKFGADANEMMFARWMTFLTAVCCAVYGMDPAEINSDAFSAGPSPLSGSDTAERLASSRDKGLRPLLSYFENLFTDYAVRDFSDDLVFRWTGLNQEDEDKRHELRKLVLTVDEIRAQEGWEPDPNGLGDAPVNPSLVGPWMQMQQADQGGDFGEEEGDDQSADQGEDQESGEPMQPGEDDGGQPQRPDQGAPGKAKAGAPAAPAREEEPVTKSLPTVAEGDFGFPELKVFDDEATH